MCAGHLQELTVNNSVGWLLRGGIAIGQLFIDDVMVWGDALLKAYYLENKTGFWSHQWKLRQKKQRSISREKLSLPSAGAYVKVRAIAKDNIKNINKSDFYERM